MEDESPMVGIGARSYLTARTPDMLNRQFFVASDFPTGTQYSSVQAQAPALTQTPYPQGIRLYEEERPSLAQLSTPRSRFGSDFSRR
ncbi:hypothetical protein RRG08_028739 [Elysia crispata]|uniref:Uncharacterized protein n=1 Tax=Elysia crispata TaxID=231223 RepID=A0AAE0ZMY9_9GAST|nr:hypothetical protein RRG08_028739 [Elysia crispata]